LAGYHWWPPPHLADGEFATLRAEQEALRTNDDATRARMRTERDRLARQIVPVPLADLKTQLGPHWTWQPGSGGRWLVSRSGSRPDDWLDVLAGVAALERQPGVFLEQVEMRGDGRAFTQARITIRFQGQTGETPPGLGPRPAPVSAMNAPAVAPAVGRVRSRRRPGPSVASAPTPGRPRLAPSRPDTRRGPVPC
ncbi:MAG: hypothetical protein RL091_1694, partial [Verrucomicrobiota bacterium]